MMDFFVDWYAIANLFLVLSFVVYLGGRTLLGFGQGRVSNRIWLRVTQGTVIGALLLPLFVAIAPFALPTLTLPSFWPAKVVQSQDGRWQGSEGLVSPPAQGFSGPENAPQVELSWFESSLAHRKTWWFLILGTGLLLGLGRASFGLGRLKRFLSQCTPLKKIGRVHLLVSDGQTVPFATRGLSQVFIVVPSHLLGSWKYLKLAIKHEIQHHRQGDTFFLFFVELLKILFFFNPALYLWAKEITALQELACDEALIAKKGVAAYDYGGCLLYVAESTLPKGFSLFGSSGMSCGSSGPKPLLNRRILMLGSHTRTDSRIKLAMLTLTLSVGLVSAVAFASSILGKGGETNAASPAQTHPTIQKITEAALLQGVARAKAQGGFAVLTDVRTGQVLAAAHVKAAGGVVHVDSPNSAFLKESIGLFSLTKPLILAETMDKGGVKAQDVVDCEGGSYEVHGTTYLDWKPFGKISVGEVLTHSSNIGAIKITNSFGGPRFARALPVYGFGSGSVASQYPNAGSGVLLPPDLLPADVLGASLSVGDPNAVQATPLEVVQAYAALANGGSLYVPQSYTSTTPKLVRRVISPGTSQVLRTLLEDAVTTGTGQKAATASYSTAGKTATSPKLSAANGLKGFASFAGFAPATDPRIAVYVGIENPPTGQGSTGGSLAAPLFSQIVEPSLQELGVTPDL